MKLAHLSDIHAGYSSGKRVNSQGINLRLADGYIALNKMVTDIIKENVDVVLIAGDTFHSAYTDSKTIIYVQNQLRRLSKAKIPVYILAGNHDVTDVKTDIAISRILHDPARKIESFIEPYEIRHISDNIVLHMISHHAYADQADTLLKVKPIDGKINIFSSHGSVISSETQERLHTEGAPREVVIPTTLLEDGFDAALLGHIHERKFVKVSKDLNNVFYNGSLIRRGYSDGTSDLERGWTLWNIDEETGTFTPEFRKIEQRPQYDFEVIDAKDLSSTEISDIIINNLKMTQLETNEFDPTTAPLLRQTIKDISLAKYSALDWKNIEENAKHSIEGTLPIKKIWTHDDIFNNKNNKNNKNNNEIATNDIMKLYDNWVESSRELDTVNKDFKAQVIKQARGFMEQGREKVLDE